jgi:hypothetical protein
MARMSKQLDYSKSVIYKIVHRGENCKDCYVGSTANPIGQRKSRHKYACNHPTHANYNLPVYKFIRENGGWDWWTVIVIERFPCANRWELLEREAFHAKQLGATLNTQPIYGAGGAAAHRKLKAQLAKEARLAEKAASPAREEKSAESTVSLQEVDVLPEKNPEPRKKATHRLKSTHARTPLITQKLEWTEDGKLIEDSTWKPMTNEQIDGLMDAQVWWDRFAAGLPVPY